VTLFFCLNFLRVVDPQPSPVHAPITGANPPTPPLSSPLPLHLPAVPSSSPGWALHQRHEDSGSGQDICSVSLLLLLLLWSSVTCCPRRLVLPEPLLPASPAPLWLRWPAVITTPPLGLVSSNDYVVRVYPLILHLPPSIPPSPPPSLHHSLPPSRFISLPPPYYSVDYSLFLTTSSLLTLLPRDASIPQPFPLSSFLVPRSSFSPAFPRSARRLVINRFVLETFSGANGVAAHFPPRLSWRVMSRGTCMFINMLHSLC